jgi:hypothetical protein
VENRRDECKGDEHCRADHQADAGHVRATARAGQADRTEDSGQRQREGEHARQRVYEGLEDAGSLPDDDDAEQNDPKHVRGNRQRRRDQDHERTASD